MPTSIGISQGCDFGQRLEAKGSGTTSPGYAKLRDSGKPPDSHSIVYGDFSTLICKHKFAELADKSRRYVRRNL